MKESLSDIVEVRLASDQNSLEVLRNKKSLSFSEQSWIDLKGDFPPFLTFLRFVLKEALTNADPRSPRRVRVFSLSHKCDGDVGQRSRGGGAPESGSHDDHRAPAGVVRRHHPRTAGEDERQPRRRPHAQQRSSGAEPKQPGGGVQLRCQL